MHKEHFINYTIWLKVSMYTILTSFIIFVAILLIPNHLDNALPYQILTCSLMVFFSIYTLRFANKEHGKWWIVLWFEILIITINLQAFMAYPYVRSGIQILLLIILYLIYRNYK